MFQQAVANVNNLIAPKLIGLDVTKQVIIDNLMVEPQEGPPQAIRQGNYRALFDTSIW